MAKRWLELLRENKRVAIVAACAIVFLVLLEDVLEGGLIKLDEAAYVLIVEHLRTDWLTPIMESISALATGHPLGDAFAHRRLRAGQAAGRVLRT